MQLTQSHPYADIFDREAVSELECLGITNLIGAVRLDPESDPSGDPMQADIYWVWFSNPLSFPDILPAEGKFYMRQGRPMHSTLIHYSPSGPVGNAGRFERRYAGGLVGAGYHVFTGRRNGASLLTEHAKEVINSDCRIELARRAGVTHIGGYREKGYMPTDALDEPVTTLAALRIPFKKICPLAHSFGASMHYRALTHLKNWKFLMDKLGTVVNVAGYVGTYSQNASGFWDGTKVPADQFGQLQVAEMRRAEFNWDASHGVSEYLASMKKVALGNEKIRVPLSVGNIFFNCPEDSFIHGPLDDDREALERYGPETPNKLFISMHAPAADPRAHSMDFLTAEDLIRALEMKVSGIGIEYR